jgi:hypothetical protein
MKLLLTDTLLFLLENARRTGDNAAHQKATQLTAAFEAEMRASSEEPEAAQQKPTKPVLTGIITGSQTPEKLK